MRRGREEMKAQQCDKGLDTSMMLGCVTCSVWPKQFQSLICFYLPTDRQESSISKKNNMQRKKIHLLHEIPSFKICSHPFFPIPQNLYTSLLFHFPRAIVFILVLDSIIHFSKKEESLIHAIKWWGVPGLAYAFSEIWEDSRELTIPYQNKTKHPAHRAYAQVSIPVEQDSGWQNKTAGKDSEANLSSIFLTLFLSGSSLSFPFPHALSLFTCLSPFSVSAQEYP